MARCVARATLLAAVLALAGCGAATPTPKPVWGSPDVTILPVVTATPAPDASDGGSDDQGPSEPAARPSLPAGPIVVAALGDSLTEGQGDDSGKGGYVGRLTALLDARRPGSKVLNFGHSGWSSGDVINGTNGQASELSAALDAKPNVALVWIGSNDLWYLYEFGPEPMTPAAEAADLATYEANLDRILHDLTTAGVVVVVAKLDDQSHRPVAAQPNPTEPAFPNTTRADLALMSRHVAAYDEIVTRKAAQYGATTVDFSTTTVFTDPETLAGDGNHPNAAGYDEVARIWWQALAGLLA